MPRPTWNVYLTNDEKYRHSKQVKNKATFPTLFLSTKQENTNKDKKTNPISKSSGHRRDVKPSSSLQGNKTKIMMPAPRQKKVVIKKNNATKQKIKKDIDVLKELKEDQEDIRQNDDDNDEPILELPRVNWEEELAFFDIQDKKTSSLHSSILSEQSSHDEEDRLYQLTNALKCLEKNQEVNETSQDEDTVLPEQAAITDRTLQLSMTLLTHIQELNVKYDKQEQAQNTMKEQYDNLVQRHEKLTHLHHESLTRMDSMQTRIQQLERKGRKWNLEMHGKVNRLLEDQKVHQGKIINEELTRSMLNISENQKPLKDRLNTVRNHLHHNSSLEQKIRSPSAKTISTLKQPPPTPLRNWPLSVECEPQPPLFSTTVRQSSMSIHHPELYSE